MIDHNRPVRVFKNWKLGCYNIMQSGKLLASAKQVRLSGVEFLVRSSGRRRMLESGRRNVHAYAVGHLVDYVHPADTRTLAKIEGRRVSYDPYQCASFIDHETQTPVTDARLAQFEESCVVYD